MIKSMTAFARTEAGDALRSVVVEIRSYNSRHLDLVLRLPSVYAGLEDKVKALVAVSRRPRPRRSAAADRGQNRGGRRLRR